MFKVNNGMILVFLLSTYLTYFTLYSGASIVDFEHVIANWAVIGQPLHRNNSFDKI